MLEQAQQKIQREAWRHILALPDERLEPRVPFEHFDMSPLFTSSA